jgi:hypothetical protein
MATILDIKKQKAEISKTLRNRQICTFFSKWTSLKKLDAVSFLTDDFRRQIDFMAMRSIADHPAEYGVRLDLMTTFLNYAVAKRAGFPVDTVRWPSNHYFDLKLIKKPPPEVVSAFLANPSHWLNQMITCVAETGQEMETHLH